MGPHMVQLRRFWGTIMASIINLASRVVSQ